MENFQPRGISRRPIREVRDTRKALYTVFILDTSSSMDEATAVGKGSTSELVKKIAQLNSGFAESLNSLRRFERENVLYKVYYQIIELNSYGKALFPDFVPLSVQSEEICFEAEGVTCLNNSLTTLKSFLDPRHMPGCNHAVNVILVSDGYPTDPDGYVLEKPDYDKTIREFKQFLETTKLRAGVDLYSIGVGDGACEDMLTSFADEGKYYKVEALESLAEKLDFVTRKSLVRLSSVRLSADVDSPDSPDVSVDEVVQSAHDTADDSAIVDSVTMRVNRDGCLGSACLACVDSCPFSAIDYLDGGVGISSELCSGCGACIEVCPCGAIVPDGSGE